MDFLDGLRLGHFCLVKTPFISMTFFAVCDLNLEPEFYIKTFLNTLSVSRRHGVKKEDLLHESIFERHTLAFGSKIGISRLNDLKSTLSILALEPAELLAVRVTPPPAGSETEKNCLEIILY